MTDSIVVLDPAWQMPAKPSTQLPYTDGVISFFLASTTTPLEVFSDADLSVSLGTSVSCNSSGYPVSSGNAKTLIYVGSAAYKIQIASADFGGVLFEADEVKGALDTSDFLTSAAVARESVVAESSNRSVGLSDLGKLINVNCSAGALTMTIDAASTLGDGWFVGIRHDGTANQCKITGNGTDTFGLNGVNVTSFSLTGRGQVVWIVCNGTSFKIDKQVDALIGNTVGIIAIADRLSTPPGAPNPGERYIVTAVPTGAWSTFTEGDIAEATGFATWFKYTPAADSGWMAYVQDEDAYYCFAGAAWETLRLNVGRSALFPSEPIYPGALVAIIEDQKAANTQGGTFTSGADQTRTLNTLVYNRNTTVSLSSNQVTLPAGSWEIAWIAPAFQVDAHQSLLYDVTAAAVISRGSTERCENAEEDVYQTASTGLYRVSPSGSNTYEIRHRAQTTKASDGFGPAANLGTEVYTRVVIRAS